MAELKGSEAAPEIRLGDQLRTIAALRWRLMLNGVHTTRGALEALSRVWVGFWFTVLGLGGAVGFGVGGWYFIHNSKAIWVGVLLWPLFLFWQVFPLMATAFSERPDSTSLLRYPLGFRAYSFVRIVYGSFDVANLVGGLCSLGLGVGVIVARPALAPAAVIGLLLFAAFNLLLEQMIAAWLERWLAKRRTRELLGVVFFLVIIGVDFAGPALQHWRHAGAAAAHWPLLLPLASWLPPGLPAKALAAANSAHVPVAIGALVALGIFTAVVLKLLNLRLRAEFAGEVLSEAAPAGVIKPVALTGADQTRAPWWALLTGCDGPEAAVAQKELGMLRRSPMVFFSLAMPVALMVLFMIEGNLGRIGRYAFPIGVAYAVLTLTNLVFNLCGTDAAGVQLYFMAPIRFRQVLAGKNLAYAMLLAVEAVVLYAVASAFGYAPPALLLAATLVGFVFVGLCVFTAGNLVSIFLPKKSNLARMGRQGTRGASSMIAMAVEAVAVGLCALAMLSAHALERPAAGVAAIAVLAIVAAVAYDRVLEQVDGIALAQRETLLAELTKA